MKNTIAKKVNDSFTVIKLFGHYWNLVYKGIGFIVIKPQGKGNHKEIWIQYR